MSDTPESRSFSHQLDIEAPKDLVWQALATAEGLRSWFAPRTSFDPQVGGEVVWQWRDHHRWVQRIEILEPNQRLRTRYDSAVDDGSGGKQPLFIDFLLEGEGGTTSLRLVQSGFGPEAEFDEEYDGISRGWPVELRSLKLYLERHAGQARQICWSTLDLDLEPAEAWRRLCAPEGFGPGLEAAGESFALETEVGDRFSGVVLHSNDFELCGRADSHGGAFLRVSVERWGGQSHVWLWMGAYGQNQAELDALQGRWDGLLKQLFAAELETRA